MKYILYSRKSSESDERQIQSIDDQLNILLPLCEQRNLDVIKIIKEAYSAKTPGRKEFNIMLEQIKSGEASGIVTWDASRISRNTVDIGTVIYLMDLGKLEEVVTPSQTFKNTPSDKFMLTILCSQAKLENDNKSESVKRALVSKAERGDYPSFAPPGYINNSFKPQGTRDVSPHPEYFSLMKKLFREALTGRYSKPKLCKLARELGIKNHKGQDISLSNMQRHLSNIFYAGKFIYKGKTYDGNHIPMITLAEYQNLLKILNMKSVSKSFIHDFAYDGGLIRCAECGYAIVAETHIKKYKNGTEQTFTYYRCSKKGKIKCTQKYISGKDLEQQILEFISSLNIEKDFADWALESLKYSYKNNQQFVQQQRTNIQKNINEINQKLDNLIELRLTNNSPITNEEFLGVKDKLNSQKSNLEVQLKLLEQNNEVWLDSASKTFDLMCNIKEVFQIASPEDKRALLQNLCSNLKILDKKLIIEAQMPFKAIAAAYTKMKAQKVWLEPNNISLQQSNPLFPTNEYRQRESNP